MVSKGAWIVRKTDAFAAIAWAVFAMLAFVEDLTGMREPWLLGIVGVACTLTVIAFMTRRFERLEVEAFERGMNAAREGLIDIRDHSF